MGPIRRTDWRRVGEDRLGNEQLRRSEESQSYDSEDEAWDNTDSPEWFYSLLFKQTDLWPDYPKKFEADTLETELSERWLEAL